MPEVLAYQSEPRGVVIVSGNGATAFLQSLVSQDLDSVANGQGVTTLLLTPQGKLGFVLLALRVDDQWWLIVDDGFGAALAEALNRYRIRVEVDLVDRSSEYRVLEVWGEGADEVVARALEIEIPVAAQSHCPWRTSSRVVRTSWDTVGAAPDIPSIVIVGPTKSINQALLDLVATGVRSASLSEYEIARISAGRPLLGVDIDERTIPQEAFLERNAVSFTKGCFLGQELVCRIDTRGHVNRFLRRLTLNGSEVPERGAVVAFEGKLVGEITSAISESGQERVVALAMVRRVVEPPTEVAVGINEISAALLE